MTPLKPSFHGGLWCTEVLELLPDLVAGEVGAEERAAVEAHLRACDACARFGGRYAGLLTALAEAARQEPPAGVLERLRLRLRADLPPTR